MRSIITLSSLGLAFAVSGGAVATPPDHLDKLVGHAILDRRGSAKEPLLNYYRHKRFYQHDRRRGHDQDSGQLPLPRRRDPEGLGTPPAPTPEPVVRGLLLHIAA